MRIDVITLFPTMFVDPLSTSLLGKAIADGVIEVTLNDLREHGLGRHRSVDDTPFGGGAGMVMRPEPLFAAIEAVTTEDSHVVLMSPRGSLFDHRGAERLATREHLVLVCGRYEGVDQRVIDELVDEEISIGDYVLAGGELPALVVIEALSRFVPGVLGNPESLTTESHAVGTLEHPQYTRPAEFRGSKVPDVLLSGHHEEVERWREEESRRLTRERRPDLLGDD
ncbi:MAG: tRNA (guanosine(37)-N1)-methyltransferase TrmD [Actinobacteria bacterium]|nr:tRNA (guanosine(37)-N1)-methyltransferase TrmD [Actinomycetota bacterium]